MAMLPMAGAQAGSCTSIVNSAWDVAKTQISQLTRYGSSFCSHIMFSHFALTLLSNWY
jgi:hypothetical protein